MEKSTIAVQATLIVVGTLHLDPPFPWFDGWHFTGTIDVEEVLYGEAPTRHRAYRLIEADPKRDWRMFPTAFRYFYQALRTKCLWFLRPLDAQAWRPSVHLGCEDLRERQYYEDVIRRFKR